MISSVRSSITDLTAQVAAQITSINATTVGSIDTMEAKYVPVVRRYDH